MDAATRARRFESLRGQMDTAGLDLVAVAPTDNIRYLLGFSPHPDERACLLLVSADDAVVLMPNLNAEQSAADAPELDLLRWTDDAGPEGALRTALGRLGNGLARVGADPLMRADHLLLLQAALPDAAFVGADLALGPLREVKDADEIAALAAASATADAAMRAAYAACAEGVSEVEVAEAASAAFREAGADAVVFTIVGSGPNGAYPHHHTGPRRLQTGDAVVIDHGSSLANYQSDITRMAFVGEPSARYREIHAVVEAAVQAGLTAARPGATCHDVDAAARKVITDAGYGEQFVHRTGHGLGISTHEPPWIMRGEEVALRPGMVHSVEPGIYLPGELGVRLEEIVYVTDDGCEVFSKLPRDVSVLA